MHIGVKTYYQDYSVSLSGDSFAIGIVASHVQLSVQERTVE